ncbi:hypothetical protein ACFV0R_34570 [Streptomyces sp. NPDC059578]|uniref:hypothetical protein n=1 Tax=Streptomyces sp. NPDC059578 TaxID=3346874 RepID=UPI0036B885B9
MNTTTRPLYEIATIEDEDGTTHPAERLWTPSEDATDHGFIAHRGLHVTGLDDPNDGDDPAAFLVLGHQTWAHTVEAAAAYMAHVHDRPLHPKDDTVLPLIPRAVHTHAALLRHHPHPGCTCEWGGAWRAVWVPASVAGAVPITLMRHPAAPVTVIHLPAPDWPGVPATWAV